MSSFEHNNGSFYPDGGIPLQSAVPLDGGVIQMAYPTAYITPAAPLNTLTVRLPANPAPSMLATFMSSQGVATVFVQTATHFSIISAPAALVVNTKVTMMYVGGPANTSWVWVH